MIEDVVGTADEQLDGEPLLVPAMRNGEIVHAETLEEHAGADQAQHRLAPGRTAQPGEKPRYPVRHSEALTEAARAMTSG